MFKILLNYILGFVEVEIEGFFLERFMNLCLQNNIYIWGIKREGSTKIKFSVGINDFKRIKKITKSVKYKLRISKKVGIPFFIFKYKKRKILFLGITVLTCIIFVISGFIWNIEILGVDEEAKKIILQEIENKDIKIGIRKNKINKNEIINQIRLNRNEFSWIGIEVVGTNLKIRANLADEKPEIIEMNENCNIVATKKAKVTKIYVQNGTANVNIGDEVEEGDILINGYIDGLYTGRRNVHALGEIKGEVSYKEISKIDLQKEKLKKTGRNEKRFCVKINNFEINFYKSISNFKKYDTIETIKRVRLFSDFYLPIEIKILENFELEESDSSKEEIIENEKLKIEDKLNKRLENTSNLVDKYYNIETYNNQIIIQLTYVLEESIGAKEKLVF